MQFVRCPGSEIKGSEKAVVIVKFPDPNAIFIHSQIPAIMLQPRCSEVKRGGKKMRDRRRKNESTPTPPIPNPLCACLCVCRSHHEENDFQS
jgi:hypothetical protein